MNKATDLYNRSVNIMNNSDDDVLRNHSGTVQIRHMKSVLLNSLVVALAMPMLLTGCAAAEPQPPSLVLAATADPSIPSVSALSEAVPAVDVLSSELWAVADVPNDEDPSAFALKPGEEVWNGPPLPMMWNLPQIEAHNNIQEYLERNSDSNGGVSVVESDYLVIHLLDRTAPSAELDALVNAAKAVGAAVEFDRVQRPLAELLKLQFNDIPEGLSSSQLFAGTKVVQWGVQPATNSVEVTVTEVTLELGERVFAEFGAAVTIIQGVDPHMSVALGRLPLEGFAPE